MGLIVTGEDARVGVSFEHAAQQVLQRSACVGIIQVKLCCEQMDHQACRLLDPLLAGDTPTEIREDRILLLAAGEMETVIALFESVKVCLELAAHHSPECLGQRLYLTIAENGSGARELLRRADREFRAPLKA